MQTPLGTQPSLGTKPCYKAPGDLLGRNCKGSSGEGGCPLDNDQKLAVKQPNSSYKNYKHHLKLRL